MAQSIYSQTEVHLIFDEEFLRIQELLEDLEDLQDLRETKKEEGKKPSISLEELKQMF